jgi:hypothetical protein
MVRVSCVRGADRAFTALVLAAGLAAAGSALPAATSAALKPTARRAQIPASLRLSPALWATIDVCNPPDQRFTIGVRGSMPSDGAAHDTMFMRFRLQHTEAASHRWVDVEHAASNYLPMGSSRTGAEAGRSFTLVRPTGAAFVLRGVVSFQWRRGAKVLETISRPTRAGHVSQTGADPADFSAATCRIA